MSIHPPSRNETAAGVLGPAQATAVANLPGGNIDTTHNNLLTTAQVGIVDACSGWDTLQKDRIKALGLASPPQNFFGVKLGFDATGNPPSDYQATANDHTVLTKVTNGTLCKGGSRKWTSCAQGFGPWILQNPSAASWAFVFRGILGAVSAQYQILGIQAANGDMCQLGGYQAYDATHMVLISTKAGGTAQGGRSTSYVLDANEHDYGWVYDVTNQRALVLVDGAVAGTLDLTNAMTAQAAYLYLQCGTVPIEISLYGVGV